MRLPDRWLDYSAVGKVVEGTRFVAIKVPLERAKNQHFSCKDAISEVENSTGRRDGMMVDLTFTDKYYSPQCVEELGVKHVKIKVPGQVIPPGGLVKKFHKKRCKV